MSACNEQITEEGRTTKECNDFIILIQVVGWRIAPDDSTECTIGVILPIRGQSPIYMRLDDERGHRSLFHKRSPTWRWSRRPHLRPEHPSVARHMTNHFHFCFLYSRNKKHYESESEILLGRLRLLQRCSTVVEVPTRLAQAVR